MGSSSRRQFLHTMAAGAAAFPFAPNFCAAAPPRRPNFIFIYTDDQRWDAVGCVQKEMGDGARFPWFRSPNMDRLAAEGVRFRNAFVVNSLCSPSRACFLTSQYSHLNGIANNHTHFPVDSVTHATCLRLAGYKTAYVGKWHMYTQRGQRPGFDYSASWINQGRYVNCPFEINGVPTPTTGWCDDVATDYALEFIKDNTGNAFSLVLGFKSVHDPRQPPDRTRDLFQGAEPKPPVNREPRAIYLPPVSGADPAWMAPPVENIRDYFRCLAAVDQNIGRVLDLLDQLKLAEDTVVIFTSDNGYYIGEHGLGDKRSAYEESLRIPFLVRYPRLGVKGRTVDQMILNIDLAPTLLDFAGVDISATMQGRSWKPLLEAKTSPWREAFFYEYFYEAGPVQNTPTVLAVRTDAAKLIKYPGHEEWTELFDLKHDPYEMKNLASDRGSKDLLAKMETEFDRQSKVVRFKVPDYSDKPAAEPSKATRKP